MPPPLALSGLLRRLSLPQMGLRLPKEQLCLSLASIGKLDLTPLELKENFNCNVIVSRTSQIASTCEPVELKMLAPGLRKLGSVAPIGQALDILAQRISSYSSIARTEAAKLDLLDAVLGLFSARDRWQRKLCLRPVLRKCLEESSAPLLARAIIASLRSGEPLTALDQRLQVLRTSYKEVGSSTAFQLLLELELQGSTDESITAFMGELSKHCITMAQSLSDEEFIELSSSTTLSKASAYVDGLHRRLEPSTRNVPLDSLATLLCSGVPLNGALFESIVQTLSAVDDSTLPHVDAMVSIVAGCCRRKIPVPPMLIRQLKESTLTLSCINTPGDLSQWSEAWTHVDPSARNTAILTKLKDLNSVENLMEEVDKLSNDAEDQFVASLLLLRGVQVGLFHGSLSTDAQTLSKLFGKVTNSIVAEVVLDYLVFLFPQPWRGDLPLQLLRMLHRCRVRDAGVVDSLLTAVTEIALPIQPRDCALLTAILKENETLSTKHATLLKTVTDILHEDKGMELDTLPNKVLALAESGQPLSDETIFQLLRDATGKNWQPDDWAKVIAALVLSGRDVSPLFGKVDELVEGLSIAGCSLLLGAMASSAPLRKRALLKTIESLEKLLPFANPLPSLQALVRLNPSASEGTLSVIPLYLSRVGTMIPRSPPEDLCRGLSLLGQLVRIESSFEPQFQNTLRNFAAHFLTTLDSCSLAQVALVIKTFGEVDFIDSALFDVISRRLAFDAKTIKDPQTILQFLEALHVANVPQLDRFANPLVDSLHEVIDKVGETDLIAALRYLPTEANSLAMQQALGRISLSVSTMGIDQLENLCSALIRLSSVTTLQEKGSSLTEECLSRLGKLLGEGVPVHPNSINAVFQSIAAYGRKGSWGEHEIDLLTARVSDSIAQYSAPALLTLTEGLTTLQCRNPKLIHIATQRAAELAEEFSSSQLASILLQLSRLGAGGHPSIASLAEYVVDHCESFHRGCDITAILTAFGRMGHNNRNIYHVMAKRLHRRPTLHYLKREEVSLALNAFGAARYLDEGLFKALGNRVQDLIDEVDAPDIAMTLHSFTQVHLVNDNLFESLASRATEVAENFTPDGVIMTINALGKIDQQFTDMTDRLLDVLIPQLHQVEPSSVAGMLTALCLQEYNNAKHWGALSDYLCENVERLNAQGLKDLCLVMQTMTWREDRLLRSVGDQAVRLQMAQSMTGETARVVMDTMSLFLHHHQACREQLSESARSVSRETPPPLEGESLVTSSRSIGR